jgi:hypothetical protein
MIYWHEYIDPRMIRKNGCESNGIALILWLHLLQMVHHPKESIERHQRHHIHQSVKSSNMGVVVVGADATFLSLQVNVLNVPSNCNLFI